MQEVDIKLFSDLTEGSYLSEIKHLLLKENKEDLLQVFNLIIKMANKKINISEDKS